MKNNKLNSCFVICWFGPFPEYFPVWLQTVRENPDFDFMIFTDNKKPTKYSIPNNVIIKKMTLSEFKHKSEDILNLKCSVERPYRICDFRPMFGLIFAEELSNYDFWGYCDLDLVFGKINNFVNKDKLTKYDAIFNGGHFTLIRNVQKMNTLFSQKGGAFDYKTVVKHNAVFAFDEITGIQQIAQNHNIKALYTIPYVDADVKYKQLRSVMDIENPDLQCFYWEKGQLYRVKLEKKGKFFENLAYIHLQKRPIEVKDSIGKMRESFWILPDGFESKDYLGLPTEMDIKSKNPYLGQTYMKQEAKEYRIKKIKDIIKRTPFQIYVRLVQAQNRINKNHGTVAEGQWKRY